MSLPDRTSTERHLPECQQIHAPDMYRRQLEDAFPGGGMESYLRRRIADSEGIYLVVCAKGCPTMKAARKRGRELAKEYGW